MSRPASPSPSHTWNLSAPATYSSFAWAELVTCPEGNPTALQTSALARTVAEELSAAGWRLERVLTDNGNEFRGRTFKRGLRLHRTILEECWRPAFARYLQVRFTGLRQELEIYLDEYNNRREHHGRNTRGRPPADLVYGARKMEPR